MRFRYPLQLASYEPPISILSKLFLFCNPHSTTKLPGKLSVGTDAFGHKVVFYQGYPLYTYVGGKKPGDFNAYEADNSPWQLATVNVPTGL